MTPADLVAIDPRELDALTDEELGARLAPLVPAARAEFAGKGEETIKLTTGGRVTAKTVARDVNILQNLIRANSMQQTNPSLPSDIIAPPTNRK